MPRAYTDILFEMSESFSSEEGPLPAGGKVSSSFRTYGPLAVSLECPSETWGAPCLPGTTISLNFNNAVRFADLQRALGITPAELIQTVMTQLTTTTMQAVTKSVADVNLKGLGKDAEKQAGEGINKVMNGIFGK